MDGLIDNNFERTFRAIFLFIVLAMTLVVLWKTLAYFRKVLGPGGLSTMDPEELLEEFEQARDDGELNPEEYERVKQVLQEQRGPSQKQANRLPGPEKSKLSREQFESENGTSAVSESSGE